MYRSKGFTLIELLVAISVLAIASAIGLVTYSEAQIAGRDTKRKDDLRQIQTGLELYYQTQNPHFYPNSSVNSASAGWPALLSTSYINQMPAAPNSDPNYQYVYTPAGTCSTGACTYTLCTRLENTKDQVVSGATIGVVTSGADCPAGGSRYFRLTSP